MASAACDLLLVDALQRVPVDLAAKALLRHGLRPVFARSSGEALRLVSRYVPTAYAIVPPLGEGDAFALLHRLRLTHPAVPGAIVLGPPSEVLGTAARVLWTHRTVVGARLREALAAVAADLGDGDDCEWDVTTADVATAVAEASLRLGIASH